MTFKCLRCGRCCVELAEAKDWVGGKLTWEQKQELIAERKKKPKNDKGGCDMVYFDKEDLAHCLVTEMFGADIKDNLCKIYPHKLDNNKKVIKCLNGQIRTTASE